MTHTNDSKFLSALALFQEYYRLHKGDIHLMILQFICAVVDEAHLTTFTVEKVDELLREHFHIEIPSATIRACLFKDNKTFKYSNGEFAVVDKIMVQDAIRDSFDNYRKTCEDVISDIRALIEKRELVTLSDCQTEDLRTLVNGYIIDESNGIANDKYAPYIMEYFVKHEDDHEFCQAMNAAKEGLLIYQGLQYSSQTNELTWKTPTTFYLDMEYLFWAFGFNEVYDKQYFMDFYNLVKEINEGTPRHNGQPLIRLSYFKETKDEIDNYFYRASLIKQRKALPNLSSPAMCKICNECKDDVEVQKYKSKFYTFLKGLGIDVEHKTIDVTQHKDKLFETPELMDELEQTFQGEELEEAKDLIKIADYIAILRGRYIQKSGIENCRYIFLSNTNLTNRVSKILHRIDTNAKMFLFTRMGMFTDLMWFKAKKGLISNQIMPSFDIIGRAKNIMSTLIHTKVCDAYESFEKEGYSKEELLGLYSTFRDYDYRPEVINSANVEGNVEFVMSEVDLSRYKERQAALKKRAEDGDAAIIAYNSLQSEKTQIEAELEELKLQQYSRSMSERSKLYIIARFIYKPGCCLYGYYRVWVGLLTLAALCVAGYISWINGAALITILSSAIAICINWFLNINKIRKFVHNLMLRRYRRYCSYVFNAYKERCLWVRIFMQMVNS